ncbi:iron complex transport system substrate-binding protein [Enterococcus sp. AZ194]|uniref:ABC transporter substrate-binding protein n=1 Tax=Enterococcus sp. AZ194 TaxID=2774629 RepID=UPI003F291F1F
MKKWATVLITITALALFTGCGSKSEPTKSTEKEEGYPVTIQNFTKAEGGTEWRVKEQVFEKAPERVLANTQPAAELLLHLGLQDRIVGVGAVFGMSDEEVSQEFSKLNHLSDGYLSKEAALSVDPDLIYGRGGLFENEEWGNGTVDSINEMGIATFVQETSTDKATFESVYHDIDHLSELFDVQSAGENFKEELKGRESALKKQVTEVGKEQTFALLFMSDPSDLSIYSASGESFFNSMMKMVKLDNALGDIQGDASLETLIQRDPDVLIVPDWSTYKEGAKKDEMVQAVLSNEKISSLKAVKNKQVYSVDYNYMFGYGYQSLTGMEQLAEELYGK